MTNQELIACIQAEERGEVVECTYVHKNEWFQHEEGVWDTTCFNYRIRRKPRKCWVKWSDNPDGICPWQVVSSKEETGPGWQLVTEEIK